MAPLISLLIIAASLGAAIAVILTDKSPSKWNNALGLGKNTKEFTSRYSDDTSKTPGQVSLTSPQPTSAAPAPVSSLGNANEPAPTVPTSKMPERASSPTADVAPTAPTPQPSNGVPLQMNSPTPGLSIAGTGTQVPARVASVGNGNEPVPNVRGVTDKEIQFGISAPFWERPRNLATR